MLFVRLIFYFVNDGKVCSFVHFGLVMASSIRGCSHPYEYFHT